LQITKSSDLKREEDENDERRERKKNMKVKPKDKVLFWWLPGQLLANPRKGSAQPHKQGPWNEGLHVPIPPILRALLPIGDTLPLTSAYKQGKDRPCLPRKMHPSSLSSPPPYHKKFFDSFLLDSWLELSPGPVLSVNIHLIVRMLEAGAEHDPNDMPLREIVVNLHQLLSNQDPFGDLNEPDKLMQWIQKNPCLSPAYTTQHLTDIYNVWLPDSVRDEFIFRGV
jgi:hypothetical protein